MTTETVRGAKDHFSDVVDRAERHHERVVVTRNGHPAAVVMSYEDLEALEETLDILSDPDAMRGIRESEEEIARGDVVRGVEAVRRLRERE